MNSDDYNVRLGVDFGDASSGVDAFRGKLVEVKEATIDTQKELEKANRAIVSGAKEANEAQTNLANSALAAKKIAEERTKAERVLSKAYEEVNKRQQENIQLSEKQERAVAEYIRTLEYNKKALKEASDPTQIAVLSKEIEKMQANIVKHFDEASKGIEKTKEGLQNASGLIDQISDSLIGAFSDADFEELGKAINASGDEMEQLGTLIDFIASKMEGMDKESDLFKDLTKDIELANEMLGRVNDNVDISTYSFDQLNDRLRYFQDVLKSEVNPQEIIRINQEIERTNEQLNRIKNAGKEGFDELGNKLIPDAEEKTRTLNTELREVVQQLAKMRMEGKIDTPEYDELLEKAGHIKNSLGDVNDELKKVSSSTRGLDALIDTSKLIAAGFGVAQGAAHLFGKENEDVQQTIVKLTSSISILQGLQQIQVELKNKESVANKALTASQALYTIAVGNSTGALKAFRIALASTGIGLIVLAIGALIANWDKLTESVKLSGEESEKWGERIDKTKQIAMGVGNAVLQYLIAPIKTFYSLLTDGPKAAIQTWEESLDVVRNYSIGVGNEIKRQNDKLHRELLEDQRKELSKQIELRKVKGEETIELERALLSTELALSKQGSEERKELLHDLDLFEAKIGKDKADRLQKEGEEANRRAKEAEQRRQAELQRIAAFNRELIDLIYAREEKNAEIRLEGQAKEEELERIRFDRELEGLRRQLQDFEGTEQERLKLKQELDKLVELAEEEHAANMIAIGITYSDKAIESQRQLTRAVLQLQNEGEQLEIDAIKVKYEKIKEQLIESGKSQTEAEIMVVEATNREVDAVRQKYALKALEDAEKVAVAQVSIMEIQGADEEELAREKEIAKLQVLIEASAERLEILKRFGEEENKVAIAQTEALIHEMKGKVEELSNSTANKPGGLFSLFGLDVTPREERMVLTAWKRSLSSITRAYQEAVQMQIDAKQNQINQLSNQISQLESELQKEIALQEKGYANNVDAKKKEIDALRAEREREVAEQEELQKRQQKIAIAQVAMNGVIQTSEMISAAASIYKRESRLGLVGVLLATAAVGTMIATFASIKNQVKAMQEGVPSFRKGGSFFLDGPSHEHGGLGVYNEKTGRRVAEVEGGEGFFAINKKSTSRYRHILEAFNNDDLQAVGSMVDSLLAGTGIVSDQEQHGKVILIANSGLQKEQEYKDAMIAWANSKSLESIAYTNKQLLLLEKGKTKVTETENYIIEEKGSVLRRIKKKKLCDTDISLKED